MELRELIERIGSTYDRELGIHSEAQELLKQAPEQLSDLIPAGMLPDASGGRGNAAVIPWIAVFQPDETTSAQHGMYVVYLFAADMSTVVLSLNQGVTELVQRFGAKEAREKLAQQAVAVRERLPADQLTGFDETIELHSSNDLPRSYEAGNITARTYRIEDLPSDREMVADLSHFVRMYELALEVRDGLRISTPDKIVTTKPVDPPSPEVEFKPKDDDEYLQYFKERTLRKRRDHERVVKHYGNFLAERGFTPNTNVHPRDMTADRGGEHWLTEVKVVYRGDGVQATRDALSQLLMYREFLYAPSDQPRMLAVFSEDVGSRNVRFLERFEIASVWKQGTGWSGSPIAQAAGLTSGAF